MSKMQITNITPTAQKENDKIRIAAYCRVSTDSQDQINSFAAQIRHYSDYVNRNPRYTLIDIYADEEIIYGEQKIINLRNRSYFFTENKNVLLEHKPKTIEKNQ